MSTIEIYRVEDRNSRSGPFWTGVVQYGLRALGKPGTMHYNNPKYPGWYEDKPINNAVIKNDLRFTNLRGGCTSIKDVVHWFSKELCAAMETFDKDIVLAVYEVAEASVFRGKRQVAFDPSRATLKETRKLSEAIDV